MNLVIQDFFSFGVHHFFETVGWYRVVSVLSTFLGTFQVDPIHCILAHFPVRSVKYLPWFCHVVKFVFLLLVHGTAVKIWFAVLLNPSLLQSEPKLKIEL